MLLECQAIFFLLSESQHRFVFLRKVLEMGSLRCSAVNQNAALQRLLETVNVYFHLS